MIEISSSIIDILLNSISVKIRRRRKLHWIYLCLAILFEVSGTTTMKLSDGFTKVIPSVLLILFYICSLCFLTLTLKSLEVSIAYANWIYVL